LAKSLMKDEWQPSERTVELLREKFPRADLEYYLDEMRDHFLANGKLMASWDATYRNWVRRAMSGMFGNPKLLPYHTEKMQEKRGDVIELATIHAARSRGIDTQGRSEAALNHLIWEHDQARRGVK